MSKGFYAIGIYHPKSEVNVGTLWRSAMIFGASFIFTVGNRYRRQASDTPNVPNQLPYFSFLSMNDLKEHLPYSCPLIGVELDPRALMLSEFSHPKRACYLLGAEDHGLPPVVLQACNSVIKLPGTFSMNVSVAGSIVCYDRLTRGTS
jgi:tRNA G18 (ribose-2'-O)-methylase SpoU